MNPLRLFCFVAACSAAVTVLPAAETTMGGALRPDDRGIKPVPRDAEVDANPADRLPPSIRRLTQFGERVDWSHDGKRILFLDKTFGDVYEIEVATGIIRLLSGHYPHHGYTRALYLSNGDILLSGPNQLDPMNRRDARVQCFLSVLGRDLTRPPTPLPTKCSEGPAVSRRRLHIAWTHVSAQYPDTMERGSSRMLEADLVYENGVPRLARERVILESKALPFTCTLEVQNFRLPDERELTFSTYNYQGTETFGVDLATGRVTNYSNAPEQYDEPEGLFPDGRFTLVESDRQNRRGSNHVDLWKLALDGSGAMERLTHFSDFAGYKGSNGVVSDDGRYVAFQLARSRDAAGVGYGIFILDLHAGR